MNLDIAIYRINLVMSLRDLKEQKEFQEALQLGIEALKRILDVRRFPDASNWKPLPGETDD